MEKQVLLDCQSLSKEINSTKSFHWGVGLCNSFAVKTLQKHQLFKQQLEYWAFQKGLMEVWMCLWPLLVQLQENKDSVTLVICENTSIFVWISGYFRSEIRFSIFRKQHAVNKPQATQWIKKIFNSQSLRMNIAHLMHWIRPVLGKIICNWKTAYGHMKWTNNLHYIISQCFNAELCSFNKIKSLQNNVIF